MNHGVQGASSAVLQPALCHCSGKGPGLCDGDGGSAALRATASASLLLLTKNPTKHRNTTSKSTILFIYGLLKLLQHQRILLLRAYCFLNHTSASPDSHSSIAKPCSWKQKHVHAVLSACSAHHSHLLQQSCPGTALPGAMLTPPSAPRAPSCQQRDTWCRRCKDTWCQHREASWLEASRRTPARLKLLYKPGWKAYVYIKSAIQKCHYLIQQDLLTNVFFFWRPAPYLKSNFQRWTESI